MRRQDCEHVHEGLLRISRDQTSGTRLWAAWASSGERRPDLRAQTVLITFPRLVDHANQSETKIDRKFPTPMFGLP